MTDWQISPPKRVVIIGPECTGKSSLSAQLAAHYQTQWVAEYARTFLDTLDRPYNQEDLQTIAHGQLQWEDEKARTANQLLFCDTNLYVIKIWSEFKYGYCDDAILRLIDTRPYDLYLLMYIDIPWQEDPQREHPHQREVLYQRYLQLLQTQSTPFVEISGQGSTRFTKAIHAVEKNILGKL